MKIKCIRGNSETLVTGKIYETQEYKFGDDDDSFYYIMNEFPPSLRGWYKDRFEVIEEEKVEKPVFDKIILGKSYYEIGRKHITIVPEAVLSDGSVAVMPDNKRAYVLTEETFHANYKRVIVMKTMYAIVYKFKNKNILYTTPWWDDHDAENLTRIRERQNYIVVQELSIKIEDNSGAGL